MPVNLPPTSTDPSTVPPTGGTGAAPAKPPPSFIHFIFQKYGFLYEPKNIDDTSNGIWLKHDCAGYPWGKKVGQPKIIELLGHVTNYAVSENKNAVNFLLWSDIHHNWYFRSLDSIIKDAKAASDIPTFFVNPNLPNVRNRITNIESVAQSDNISILENNILYSSYNRIDPDYTNPYLDFIDTNAGMTNHYVTYEYTKDFKKTTHVNYQENPIFDVKKILMVSPGDTLATGFTMSRDINEGGKVLLHHVIPLVDDIHYGYFSQNQYNTPTPMWWDYLGKVGDKHNNIVWQTQYDLTDLPFQTFYDIHTKVRVPLLTKRLEFNRLKNLKRKWETYRCVVCCLDQPIGCLQDMMDFANAALIPTGKTFEALFGSDGLFHNKPYLKDYIDIGNESKVYEIVAAGSFCDNFNYIRPGASGASGASGGLLFPKGLSYAIDVKSYPYNETIGSFYNLSTFESIGSQPGSSKGIIRYKKQVITNGLKSYDTAISLCDSGITFIHMFLEKSKIWINAGITFINSNLIHCSECNDSTNRESILQTVNNYWAQQQHLSNDNLQDYFSEMARSEGKYTKGVPCGFSEKYGGPRIPTYNMGISGAHAGASGGIRQGIRGGASGAHGVLGDGEGNKVPYSHIKGVGTHVPHIAIPKHTCLKTVNFNTDPYLYNHQTESGVTLSYIPNRTIFPDWCIECSKYMGTTMFQWRDVPVDEICIGDYCYSNHCFNPNVLISLREHAYREHNKLKAEKHLLQQIRLGVSGGIAGVWDTKYKEWSSRKAFFYSKTPGTSIISGGTGNTGGYRNTQLGRNTSLQNIKSITRRPIRGSRYEILSRAKGITGGQVGSWLYDIFFPGGSTQDYNGNSGPGGRTGAAKRSKANPYYDQTFFTQGASAEEEAVGIQSNFVTDRMEGYYLKKYIKSNTQYDFLGISGGTGGGVTHCMRTNYHSVLYGFGITGEIHDRLFVGVPLNSVFGISYDFIPGVTGGSERPIDHALLRTYGPSGADGPGSPGVTPKEFIFTYDVFHIPTLEKSTQEIAEGARPIRPPNLKREEIASYMRIEFIRPIGLDRIKDFPNGFIRDVGTEYFLPYLVSLTAGPTGRQTIRNNVVIIGMDPYGFDVAVKKSKIENRYDERNYWWWEGDPRITQTELSRNGMDLWPEYMFETKYPYYASDSRGIYSYSNWYEGFYESNKEQFNKTELPWQRSSEIDAEHRKTAMGSGILMSSHKKMKPHRSWWSFHFPHNIFIPQKLFSAFRDIYSDNISDIVTVGHTHVGNLAGEDFDGWLTFAPGITLINKIELILNDSSAFKPVSQPVTVSQPVNDSSASNTVTS